MHLFCVYQSKIVFSNTVVVVVKKEFRNDILLDHQKTTMFTWKRFMDYYVGWSAIRHDTHGHIFTVNSDSGAKFAAYVYGYSILNRSSSAYGYTVGYKGRSIALATESQPNRSKNKPVYPLLAILCYFKLAILICALVPLAKQVMFYWRLYVCLPVCRSVHVRQF